MRLPRIRVEARLECEDAALAALYPDAPAFFLRGGDGVRPLSGVAVFANDEGPHWHYVGFGLRADAQFELTFRLAVERLDDPSRAPRWPARLLAEFARHVARTGSAVSAGHYLCLPEPVDPSRRVRCGALVPDPQLAEDPERPRFLQIVGLHERELRWISGDAHQRFLRALARRAPLWVTEPERPPVDP